MIPNPYPGVNAHLNSYLQSEDGEWPPFHAPHITHLLEVITEALPANYYAVSEKGLQIRDKLWFDVSSDIRLRPDVAIYKTSSPVEQTSRIKQGAAPMLTKPIFAMIDEEEQLSSVVLYQQTQTMKMPRAVTRIELLSPANKPRGSYHDFYMRKRWESLSTGLNLVEIDYLHTSPCLLSEFPQYPHERDAFPYTILITDPHPTLTNGVTQMFGVGVMERLPKIDIPLLGNDIVLTDLQQAYQKTLAISGYYLHRLDYTRPPVHFDRYREDDQMRLREHLARMATPSDATPEES